MYSEDVEPDWPTRKWEVKSLGDTAPRWWYAMSPEGSVRIFPSGWEDALEYAYQQAYLAHNEVP
jgi:hypothetical protein